MLKVGDHITFTVLDAGTPFFNRGVVAEIRTHDFKVLRYVRRSAPLRPRTRTRGGRWYLMDEEGTRWARGWETRAAKALEALAVLDACVES